MKLKITNFERFLDFHKNQVQKQHLIISHSDFFGVNSMVSLLCHMRMGKFFLFPVMYQHEQCISASVIVTRKSGH